jgi:hypothetical protein
VGLVEPDSSDGALIIGKCAKPSAKGFAEKKKTEKNRFRKWRSDDSIVFAPFGNLGPDLIRTFLSSENSRENSAEIFTQKKCWKKWKFSVEIFFANKKNHLKFRGKFRGNSFSVEEKLYEKSTANMEPI